MHIHTQSYYVVNDPTLSGFVVSSCHIGSMLHLQLIPNLETGQVSKKKLVIGLSSIYNSN